MVIDLKPIIRKQQFEKRDFELQEASPEAPCSSGKIG
jgi:hypothetical protein